MTRLWNDPTRFRDEMAAGLVAAHAGEVQSVTGGVIRSTQDAEPTVAVVIGGGSGHYPAFAGLVGPGLAHGAVMGNIFASPSAHHVAAVAAAVEEGRGVLLSYGNYAGDVLNFDAAQTDLRARGLDVRTVRVTDDICSAPAGREHERRGIAGDLAVFKIAGAAAARGADLDEVERVARLANERTRSLGVAFGGCTLPGADAPLFDVPAGTMAVGLGIHGEPGLEDRPLPTAAELAEMFVERLLAEIPPGADAVSARVVPLLNGLGGIGDEELYVVYGTVDALLRERGIEPVAPEVGQLCTSFDMPGVSLTLLWLDDELERLWRAPASSPAFRVGAPAPARPRVRRDVAVESVAVVVDDVDAAPVVVALETIRDTVAAHADDLGRLDAIAGDGDHGIGMSHGATAAAVAARHAAGEGRGGTAVLHAAADAWSDAAGGTSGALWSLMLHTVADRLAAGDAVAAVSAARDAVMASGGAQPGDKTMVDALVPFVDTLRAHADDPLPVAWRAAAAAARSAAEGTAELVPRRGRARTHGERSRGTPDPGAVSLALIVEALGRPAGTDEGERE
ncbi:dihydroxyacetone kinase family protein [Microbacterium sp.]|uniref:dihydroxyacetone kinase family protein n=1 Tax=Microbacterium sp. TaxID=51671 RepID=UPI003A89C1B4